MPNLRDKIAVDSILVFLIWAFIFGIIYAQSPLFTSNQNQYFLHGLANAGFGDLKSDWLANTRDPTPVFSMLVEYTYRISNNTGVFYLYYFIIFGVYLFSLVGITGTLYDISATSLKLTLITGLLLLHSAALRFVLSIGAGPEWIYIFEGGLAGQRLLGSVFQPSSFGVFLLLSIYLFLKNRVLLSLVAIGVAVTMHPTYLLASGILVFAYLLCIFLDGKNFKEVTSTSLIAILVVSPIFIYTFQSFGGTTSLGFSRAREILVNYRIPHHAVIGEWFNITSIIQLGLIILAIYLIRNSRLFLILVIGILFATILTLLQLFFDNDALALLFPWRISAILLPISIAVILGSSLAWIFNRYSTQMKMYRFRLVTVNLIIISGMVIIGAVRFSLDQWRQSMSPEHTLFETIRGGGSEDDVYLIPLKLQDFRLATGKAAYVDFKSIPYLESEVLEWYRRNQIAGKFYSNEKLGCGWIDEISKEERISHIVIEVGSREIECGEFKLLHRDNSYLIYQRK